MCQFIGDQSTWQLTKYMNYHFHCINYCLYSVKVSVSFNKMNCTLRLSVWLSDNTLVLINVVTLRQARLVPGWVTTSAQNQSSRSILSLSHHSVERRDEYPAKAGEVNRHIAWYTSPYPWSCSVGRRLASNADQRRCTGSGSALVACSRRCDYTSPH